MAVRMLESRLDSLHINDENNDAYGSYHHKQKVLAISYIPT